LRMIKLRFKEFRYPELENKLDGVGKFIRLFGEIRFKTRNGWQKRESAIIDTGAPISMLPMDLWKSIETEILTDHEAYGINPGKECSIQVLVGKVKCILVDNENNQSDELEILSYLAITNKIPLIIGFRDVLENFDIHLNFKDKTAYLQ